MSTVEQQTTARPQQDEGIVGAMSRSVLRRFLVGLAASGATAATAFLTRKARELWEEKAAPAIEEKGGLDAVAKEAFARASNALGSASSKVVQSEPVATVAEKVESLADRGPETDEPEIQPVEQVSDPEREAERRERRKRREARQRALKSSRAI